MKKSEFCCLTTLSAACNGTAGLNEQLDKIREGILKGIDAGEFHGSCSESGMTKHWKAWDGECRGYEGSLCDGYLVLLAMNP
ncbi:MAG: hypothetical protein NTY95_01930 [Bacteroidia bacterium]|jgi:hypothetical protein|nr:hypothetical protein [Bacteroidia bacterium]